ncbi:GTPase IMAP family member 8-like [Garra rufa]|uniref:GTPase IMAP family member 8-like n=1 Tax=Garra rufa TaxID=137080 RepID=UPI003CCE5DFE
MSEICYSSDDPVIRILLMGRYGSGQSSSANTILGEKMFKVKKHETEIYEGKTQIGEKQVHVITSPDLLDPDLSEEQLEELKAQLVSQCSTGLSAVLLTVPLEQPVHKEEEILDYIKDFLGPEVQKYMMVLFTRGDELEDLDEPLTIEEYLKSKDHADLQQLVTECGGRFHCFNNKKKEDIQVEKLLHKIEEIMRKNRGKFTIKQMKRRGSLRGSRVNFSGKSPAKSPDDIQQIPESKDLRLVLLGKTGCGKSATANTIIGRKVFDSSATSTSQTKECQSETTLRFHKEITVIDTPGLYDTELSKEQVQREIVKCVTFASPGPHAFIIIIRVGRFTEEEKNTVQHLKEVFGKHILKYTMILFTYKDQLEKQNMTSEQYLQKADPALKELVQSCGNRCFFLDNESASFQQFKDLISKIEKMMEENGGMHFTSDMFDETEKCIHEIQKQILDEKVKLFKQQNKCFPKAEWKKKYWRLVEESRQEAEQLFSETNLHLLGSSLTSEEGASAPKEAEHKATGLFRAVIHAFRERMCVIQ